MPQPADRATRVVRYVPLLALLFAAGVLLAGWRAVKTYRAPGAFDGQPHGFWDFHQGIYLPALAFTHGVSPYSNAYAKTYPVDRPTPPYSPGLFLLHAPITLLPLHAAEWVYFAVCAALCLTLGYQCAWAIRAGPYLHAVAWACAAAIVWSRVGQAALKDCYFTLELAVGAVVALELAARRPGWSSVGFLFASSTPTFAIPLAVVLALRGNYRAMVYGVALSGCVALLAAGWLVTHGGIEAITAVSTDGQAAHLADANEKPANNWTRVDLAAMVAKWLGANPGGGAQLAAMGVLMLPVGMALRSLRMRGENGGAATPSGAVAALAMVVTFYSHFYSTLLLAPAVAGLVSARPSGWDAFRARVRVAIAALAVAPWWNVFSTRGFLRWSGAEGALYAAVTSVNGLALAAALGLAIWETARRR